ncbi:MAG: WD40/YVTN/BNR-like repeat-containing protein [Thermoanaerobaculia bacterium]
MKMFGRKVIRVGRVYRFLVVLVCLAIPASVLHAARGQWTRFGPEGGHVRCLAVSPSNPRTVYLGTARGLVFRSVDGGVTWAFASSGIPPQPGGVISLAVDPKDPMVAYAAGGLLYKTVDGGVNWQGVSSYPGTSSESHAVGVIADPVTSGRVYVFTDGAGVFKSTDGGTTWSAKVSGLDGLSSLFILALAIAPSNPTILYLSTSAGIFLSNDSGDHWNPTALTTSDILTEVAVDPRNSSIVLAGGYRTTDGGKTWAPSGMTFAFFDPVQPITYGVVTGRDGYSPIPVPTVFKSNDSGTTWERLAAGPPREIIESLAVTDGAVLAGFRLAGVYRSEDQGRSWMESNSGLIAVDISLLAVSPAVGSSVWVGTQDGHVFHSGDGGRNWTRTSLDDTELDALVADPLDPEVAYALTIGRSRRTTDEGLTWSINLESGFWNGLVSDPKTSGTLYATSSRYFNPDPGVFKSIDGGSTWKSLGFPAGANIFSATAVDPLVPSRVYLSSGVGLLRSDDAGATWTFLTSADVYFASEIVVGRDSSSTVFAMTDSGPQRSTDLGAHWEPIPDLGNGLGIDSYVKYVFAPDPRNNATVYAATADANGLLEGRVFVSRDAGQSWVPFTYAGLLGDSIIGLAATVDGRLYAATISGGVFEIHGVSISSVPSSAVAPAFGRPALRHPRVQ